MNAIVIPTTNNFTYLVRTIESIRDYTRNAEWRLIIVDNGSSDDTPGYLKSLSAKGVPLTVIRNEENVGFIKATNQGLQRVEKGENIVLANDDIQIVDPLWLRKMEDDLKDPQVGIVVPVSNYVMGLQGFHLSFSLPTKHNTNVVVYFCGLLRWEAFDKVGLLDERYGIGGHDDLDYSVRLRDAGYKLLVDREVFVYHYGSTTLLRNGNQAYKDLDERTRKIFVEKWGQARLDELFTITPDLVEWQNRNAPPPEEEYGEAYYARFGHGGYERNEFWLGEWKRIADEILKREPRTYTLTILDVGCAMGMLVEALRDKGHYASGIDISRYAIEHASPEVKPKLRVASITELESVSPMNRYDLVTCIETLEHLSESDGRIAIGKICNLTDRILFSSTPIDHNEPTHKNVKPPTYWINLFKEQGFGLDTHYDGSFLTPWTMMFVRNGKR